MNKWCPKCQARLLTNEQIEKNLSCDRCQKKHAKEFPERFKKLSEQNKGVNKDD